MTPNPQNADKFDVEEIERELKELEDIKSFKTATAYKFYRHSFGDKSPQRLAAAVKRVRELEEILSRYKNCENDSLEMQLKSSDPIKRGL